MILLQADGKSMSRKSTISIIIPSHSPMVKRAMIPTLGDPCLMEPASSPKHDFYLSLSILVFEKASRKRISQELVIYNHQLDFSPSDIYHPTIESE